MWPSMVRTSRGSAIRPRPWQAFTARPFPSGPQSSMTPQPLNGNYMRRANSSAACFDAEQRSNQMESRKLGRSNLDVSPLGLGCWAIGGPTKYLGNHFGWGEIDEDEAIRAIHFAL